MLHTRIISQRLIQSCRYYSEGSENVPKIIWEEKLSDSYLTHKQFEEEGFSARTDLPITKVLLAIDDSVIGNRATKMATVLAANLGAELIVMSVVPYPLSLVPTRVSHGPPPITLKEYYEGAEKRAWKMIDDTVLLARNVGVKRATGRVLRSSGSTVRTIIEDAEEEKVDLIVTGTRGLRGLKNVLARSVSRGVNSQARCSVLVVR